jgi:membrane fusion protein (multidrug efflux system)
LAGAFLALNRPESDATQQSTDDAYVQADFTVVVPQAAGVIKHIAVADHQYVRSGDPLVDIDDRDLLIVVDNAQAQTASA